MEKAEHLHNSGALENVLQPLALAEINHPIDSVFELKDYNAAILRIVSQGLERFY